MKSFNEPLPQADTLSIHPDLQEAELDTLIDQAGHLLAMASLRSDQPSMAESLHSLGRIFRMRGQQQIAESMCEQALELDPKALPEEVHRQILELHADLLADRKEYGQALFILREALAALKTWGPDVGRLQSNIGRFFARQEGVLLRDLPEKQAGEVEIQEIEALHSAVHYFLAEGLYLNEGWCLLQLGEEYLAEEDLDQAFHYGQKAMDLIDQQEDTPGSLRCRLLLSEILRLADKSAKALTLAEEALDLAEQLDSNEMRSLAHGELAHCKESLGLYKEACKHFRRARPTCENRQVRQQGHSLQSLVPICAGCRAIRDEQQEWMRLEEYFHKQLGTEFSHCLCPKCVERLYPEMTDAQEAWDGEERRGEQNHDEGAED